MGKQLNNLALLCQNQGLYDEVEMYYQRAMDIYLQARLCAIMPRTHPPQTLGPDDANVAKTLNNLASCYMKQGKYKMAEDLYKQVLTQARRCAPSPPLSQAGAREGIRPDCGGFGVGGEGGVVPGPKGGRAQCRRRSHVRRVRRLAPRSQGLSTHASPINSLLLVSMAHALQIDSPTVTTTIKNLCALYRKQGKYEAAESLENCAIRFRKGALDVVKTSKAGHPLLSLSIHCLADFANAGPRGGGAVQRGLCAASHHPCAGRLRAAIHVAGHAG